MPLHRLVALSDGWFRFIQDIDGLLTGSPHRHPAVSAAAATAAWAWALDTWLFGVTGPVGSLAPHSVPTAGACAKT